MQHEKKRCVWSPQFDAKLSAVPGFFNAPLHTLGWIAAWFFAQYVLGYLFLLLKIVLDIVFADSMPCSTGKLVRKLIDESDLKKVRISRGPRNMAAFFPLTGGILIDRRTYGKRDPIFWAIGLHELGHLLLHRVRPIGWLLRSARLLWLSLLKFERALLVGLLVYGGSLLHTLLGWALLIALGAAAFVLLDELIASIIALVKLKATGEARPAQLVGAGLVLLFALATYVGTAAVDLLLYQHLDQVAAIATDHPTMLRSGPLGWFRHTLLAIATIPCVFVGLRAVIGVVLSPTLWLKAKDNAGTIGAALFLLVTWDRAASDTGQLLCTLTLLVAISGPGELLWPTVGFLFRNWEWFMEWVDRQLEGAAELAALTVVQLERSYSVRIATALPWAAMVAYVVWYWIAFFMSD